LAQLQPIGFSASGLALAVAHRSRTIWRTASPKNPTTTPFAGHGPSRGTTAARDPCRNCLLAWKSLTKELTVPRPKKSPTPPPPLPSEMPTQYAAECRTIFQCRAKCQEQAGIPLHARCEAATWGSNSRQPVSSTPKLSFDLALLDLLWNRRSPPSGHRAWLSPGAIKIDATGDTFARSSTPSLSEIYGLSRKARTVAARA
jgi:hypothetical protein